MIPIRPPLGSDQIIASVFGGSSPTLNRLVRGTGTALADSDIADAVTGGVLSITATLTANRALTLPDAAITINAFAANYLSAANGAAVCTAISAQPLDAELTALAGLTSAADTLPYFNGAGTATTTTLTTFGRSLIDDANAAAAQTTLGLGTISTQNANAIAATGGTINGTTIGATTPAAITGTTITANTSLTVASDTDVTTILGRAKVYSIVTDVAYFAHFDHATTTNYALKQLSTGDVVINVPSTITGILSVNNSSVMTWTSTTVTAVSGITLKANTIAETTASAGVSVSSVLKATSGTASTSTTTGALVVTGGVGVSGDSYYGGSINAQSSSSAEKIRLSAAAGNNRDLSWQTSAVTRWSWRCNNTAEGGANAGSDLVLLPFSDAGAGLTTAITVTRSTSDIAFGGNVTIADAKNIVFNTTTGTKLGTATTQKIGLWNATPVVQPSGADQAAVTIVNTDGAIGTLTISAAYSQAEIQALRNKCEELADDVRNLSTLTHAIRTAGVNVGWMKGAA